MSAASKCLLALFLGLTFAASIAREATAQAAATQASPAPAAPAPAKTSTPDAASAAKAVSLELNNARDANGGCRLTYIAVNGTGAVLDKTSYEIVVFDSESRVAQFLILEFGRLSAGKTKAVEFDFANRPCKGIKRILVNDVTDCVSGGQPSTLCIDGLRTATRTDIEFGQ